MPETTSIIRRRRLPIRPSLLAQWLLWQSSPPPSGQAPRGYVGALALSSVVLISAGLAAFTYTQFLDSSRFLWGSLVHDRNAHYLFGLSLAQDIQHGDVKQFVSDLDGARTWPPLHGILVALVLLVGGLKSQLAVLPSLTAWFGTAVFGFLLTRRLVHRYGNLAGFIAVVYILASPAHRAYATDIMLESLGACLSLATLWLYLITVQERKAWAQRALGLTLTGLFFVKYNYWSLAVAAVVATEMATRPRQICDALGGIILAIDWRRWLRSQLRNPSSWILGILIAALCGMTVTGGWTFDLFGLSVSIQSPHNLLHLAYFIVFMRLVLSWKTIGAICASWIGEGYRRVLLWHGVPIALWFLWPKRLGYFLWYLFANGGENPQHDLPGSAAFYADSILYDYHFSLASAVLAATLLGVAVVMWRRLRPGSVAVILFLVIAAALTIPHPNRKSRFLHSWIAAGWALAGAGLAQAVAARGTAVGWRTAIGGGVVGGIALLHAPAWVSAGDSSERGHTDYLPASTRDLTDYYLEAIGDSQRVAILATMEIKHLLRWSYMELGGHRKNVHVDWKGYGSSIDDNRRRFNEWVLKTPCDTVVFIDVPAGTYLHEKTNCNDAMASQLAEILASQNVLKPVQRRDFSMYGCAVTIYRR